jgi:magnesium-transporting ATPase (P-type)
MILGIVSAQVVVSMIAAYVGAKWQSENLEDASYLAIDLTDKWATEFKFLWVGLTGTWILIFTNVVPISLLVSLEMVHVAQGYFMKNDGYMYDGDQDFRMDPRTTNINEELG